MAQTKLLVGTSSIIRSPFPPIKRLTIRSRPREFTKPTFDDDASDEEESNAGKMPPSDSEDDD